MIETKERFVVDEQGTRVAVLLDIGTYQKMVEELDLLDALRAYDKAIANPGEPIPFEQAIKEIESKRNDLSPLSRQPCLGSTRPVANRGL